MLIPNWHYEGKFKDNTPYNGTFYYSNGSLKIKNGKTSSGQRYINGKFLTENEIITKESQFKEWFESEVATLDVDNNEKRFRNIHNKKSPQLILDFDSISLEKPKKIIILKINNNFLIQDAEAHLGWFSKNKTFPTTRESTIKGVNYWLEDNLIEFIALTNWTLDTWQRLP